MSGGTDGDGSNEAEAMRDMAVSMGVPADKIRIEPRSESTYENIAFSAPLLHDAEQIIIVSDAFHLARAEWLAKRHWPGKTVRLHASGSCGDSTPNYLRKLSREILAWLKPPHCTVKPERPSERLQTASKTKRNIHGKTTHRRRHQRRQRFPIRPHCASAFAAGGRCGNAPGGVQRGGADKGAGNGFAPRRSVRASRRGVSGR
ncbi:hypothetical protein NEIELOOT_03076 [Neisseria elongata subsp. glycolytica ATCC 29315]|uniref:DUF218 domain-containing protein n=1 Tax=Neisseria elongata subsp. glycolytica ATCC 29315 TaxID=546263 RepID=D4DVF9_NEIEG|nr:hypothetical protein NEIELOOT_03076 [Neisseria elongata subsp. glycolytica ATCC 29315]